MNKKHHNSWLWAIAALLVAGSGVGCKQVVNNTPEQPAVPIPVAIAPTLTDLAAKVGVVSRLTPSTTTDAGVFEVNDRVGVFLHNEHANAFDPINIAYKANALLVFEPASPVFYKTYYNHGLYAYFPYNATVTNARALPFNLQKDQTTQPNRVLCDFLSSSKTAIKPQQINPNAPEIPMTFYHQMTSVVVRVKNIDGSPLSDDLATIPVKVWFENRSTGVVVDLVNFTKDATSGYEQCTLGGRTKDASNPINNRVFLGHNTAKDIGTTLFFEGLVIPEAVLAQEPLIKIQIGNDGAPTARSFTYVPASGDAIVTSGGLAQGKEHIFDLTIKGTQLLVQGGEITDWGTGSSVSQAINGGGMTSSRVIFELENETMDPNTTSITKCAILLDGVAYSGDAVYTAAASGSKARISCSINTATAFPYWFAQASFYNALNVLVWQTVVVAPNTIRVKGNPLDPNYATVLGLIDVSNKTVMPGS